MDKVDKGYAEAGEIRIVTSGMCAKIIVTGKGDGRCKLNSCKFSPRWTVCFVEHNNCHLAPKVTGLVDHARCIAFNNFAMQQFFAQVALSYQDFNFKKPSQACDLDETGFTPGRDLVDTVAIA